MIELRKKEAISAKLSTEERKRFSELKRQWREEAENWGNKMGDLLREIRDSKLYREDYFTFEACLKDLFEISRSRAYQLMDQSKMSNMLDKPLSVRVTQALKDVEPEKQVEVYRAAEKRSGKAPTPRAVRAVIDEIRKPAKGVRVDFDEENDGPKASSSAEELFKFVMMQGLKKMEFDFGRYRVIIIPK